MTDLLETEQVQINSGTSFRRTQSLLVVAEARFKETRGSSKLKILSFGCSIGDEIWTLWQMFPDAEIFACDVDPVVLAKARESFAGMSRVTIFESTMESIRQHGPYDFIHASAVLCIHPAPKDFAVQFPFSRFEEFLSLFDECLSPDGILALYNTGYRFTHSEISRHYKPLRSDIIWNNGFIDVFHPDGSPYLKRIPNHGLPLYNRFLTDKITDDYELVDCLFEKSSSHDAPVELILKPVPEGLREYETYVRFNTDYTTKELPESVVVLRRTIKFYRNADGASAGISTSYAWSSVTGDGLFERPYEMYGAG